ncbi:S26 family signal peptidase [Halovivax limisalsi]|uniref:S26 family signal peptidase n=1 Tax=Halovivax limisalsi TaxID=1453760 RepID=UPI001FFC5435|nr:S26 family signal peptidase [Halovivax limisalsi]
MTLRDAIEYGLLALGGILVLSLVLGSVLGQPVLFAYVETGSMAPTLEPGDGYVAIPAALAGEVETGDVVAFESESVHGGSLTTHRVVDERPTGYVTQGDANPFVDQSQGEPPITDGQIEAVALSVDGEVVTIPKLGVFASTTGSAIGWVEGVVASLFGTERLGPSQLMVVLFGVGLVTLVLGVFDGGGEDGRSEAKGRDRTRDTGFDERYLLVACIGLVCLAATLAMVLPAGGETYGIVSSEGNSSSPTIIPVGETDSFQYQIHNGGVVPIVSYLEPETNGLDAEPSRFELGPGEGANATVTLHAADETGYHVEAMREHRYLIALPPGAIDSLYAIHPWVPYLAIYAVLSGPLWLFWRVFGDGSDRIRSRRRSRSSSLFDWLQS